MPVTSSANGKQWNGWAVDMDESRQQRRARERAEAKAAARLTKGTTHHPDGSRTIHLTERGNDLMKKQLQAFEDKFGYPPGPDDPVFFDPDHDTPRPLLGEQIEQVFLNAAVKTGDPEILAKVQDWLDADMSYPLVDPKMLS